MSMKVKTISFDPDQFVPRFSNERIFSLAQYQDKNSAALDEVDFQCVEFLTSCRKKDGQLLTGAERMSCLKETSCILLGSSVFMGLWNDFEQQKKNSILEYLYQEKQIVSIDFFGDVIKTSGGEFVFWLRRFASDALWYWLYGWMISKCLEDRLSAVLRI